MATLSTAARDAAVDALTGLFGSFFRFVFFGSSVELANIFTSTLPASSGGSSVTFNNNIGFGTAAGTMDECRITNSGKTVTYVSGITVGTTGSGSDIEFSTGVTIGVGQTFALLVGFSITMPAS